MDSAEIKNLMREYPDSYHLQQKIGGDTFLFIGHMYNEVLLTKAFENAYKEVCMFVNKLYPITDLEAPRYCHSQDLSIAVKWFLRRSENNRLRIKVKGEFVESIFSPIQREFPTQVLIEYGIDCEIDKDYLINDRGTFWIRGENCMKGTLVEGDMQSVYSTKNLEVNNALRAAFLETRKK